MDKMIIQASITLERGVCNKKYKWKSKKRISNYKSSCRRAVIRFSCRNFANAINKIRREKRQISIRFIDDSNVTIERIKLSGISMQGYSGEHPYIQIIINRCLPEKMWGMLDNSSNQSITFPILVKLSLDQWKDIKLNAADFLLNIEKEAKILMNKSLKEGFIVPKVSKGREYDLELINPNNKRMIIAISSHVARTKSRSKEKTIQKILMDIAKMLPCLHENQNILPIIITKPIDFKNSWSFTTKGYLDFYKQKFGLIHLTTEFKNGWEDDIIGELLKI